MFRFNQILSTKYNSRIKNILTVQFSTEDTLLKVIILNLIRSRKTYKITYANFYYSLLLLVRLYPSETTHYYNNIQKHSLLSLTHLDGNT